eukprot:TRINITY_DN9500_c0_g1_i3.p3 TRINITY_DN9500_c0_g1~~TRINITY_DN9500_c0_g1_i3.p3  ORF type:complete len:102 (+),score=17.60 TRINITY_DN9500_c0_g1_i3:395-700(+)
MLGWQILSREQNSVHETHVSWEVRCDLWSSAGVPGNRIFFDRRPAASNTKKHWILSGLRQQLECTRCSGMQVTGLVRQLQDSASTFAQKFAEYSTACVVIR